VQKLMMLIKLLQLRICMQRPCSICKLPHQQQLQLQLQLITLQHSMSDGCYSLSDSRLLMRYT
jgi:hypothetical protein